MGEMIIQLRVLPNSPEVDLEKLSNDVKSKIAEVVSSKVEDMKTSVQDIAFGLKALNVYFVVDESISSLDEIENQVKEIEDVSSAEVVDMRRIVG
ncbi:MAG: elongation factor 1-beta [Candidatus Woesearchaeota archaeon]|nr:elongation factor 1-beta [Candidatus Woesearchaeota archaeon]MDN5327402.1 elongation factor 1-beta [Candidatus Woesearchaeota archaeon]